MNNTQREQLEEDRERIDGWMKELERRWGYEGKGNRWNPDNIPKVYQIKDVIIALLAAQQRVTQAEERLKILAELETNRKNTFQEAISYIQGTLINQDNE